MLHIIHSPDMAKENNLTTLEEDIIYMVKYENRLPEEISEILEVPISMVLDIYVREHDKDKLRERLRQVS